jgi:hypothetical protein
VDVGIPDADPWQYGDPAAIAQAKAYPAEPPLAVVLISKVCPWSAEHVDEHEIGEVSTIADKVGSGKRVTVNKVAELPSHGLGYEHPLLSVTYTETVQVLIVDNAATVHE